MKKKIETFLSQGRDKFYLHEMVEETQVSIRDAEDFLLPLLEEDKIEGSLEIRCPECGTDFGTFEKYHEIPEKMECEICGHKFPRADEYINVVLEVKREFFRARKIFSPTH